MVAAPDLDIVLPPELIPRDGRFGSGPSKVRDEAVAALADAAHDFLGTSHRQGAVRSVVRRVREGLAELFGLPEGYEILLGNGGATAFWDAVAFGVIEQRSSHLSLGEFSSKFASVSRGAPHLDAPEVLETPPGATPQLLDAPAGDVYAYPHNETSTGVAVPLHRPAGLGAHALVVIDATSAAGGMRVAPSDFDVYYFAPQKCFASDGGLWLAAFAPSAIERIERVKASDRWIPPSLDLTIALENSRLQQTYNTPSLATLLLLAHHVEWMNKHGGLEWTASRCDAAAQLVYGWADAHPHAAPFVGSVAHRSPVTATIDFDAAIDATAVAASLRANGIFDIEPYRKLGRNQLRIAMFPAIELDDLATLTRAIDHVIERLSAAG
ncbi:MAG: phosphoserine transaminase [Actinomycetota bacterium]